MESQSSTEARKTLSGNQKTEEIVSHYSIHRKDHRERFKSESLPRRLSKEVLKAHNGAEKRNEAPPRRMRGRATTITSEVSTGAGTVKKLMQLRHKIKFLGGTFSKSGSDCQFSRRYQNTYKTEPDHDRKFMVKRAEDIIKSVLKGNLDGKLYDSKRIPNLCKTLAELIKEQIKGCGCQRYKIIADVMIMENQGQTMCYVSRCLWNKDYDNYATAIYETIDFKAVGSVFAMYYD